MSPMIEFSNSLKKEEEGKPNLKMRYGLNLEKDGKDGVYQNKTISVTLANNQIYYDRTKSKTN